MEHFVRGFGHPMGPYATFSEALKVYQEQEEYWDTYLNGEGSGLAWIESVPKDGKQSLFLKGARR